MSYQHFMKCPICDGKEAIQVEVIDGRDEVCLECGTPLSEFVHDLEASIIGVPDEWKEPETAVSDFTAHIHGDDERAAAWQIVFDGTAVPLRSPIPHMARLPGRGEELVYLLDIEALTAEQRGRLVAHIAAKFDIPAEEVDADLDTHGCPILAEHVTVSIANPWRWL